MIICYAAVNNQCIVLQYECTVERSLNVNFMGKSFNEFSKFALYIRIHTKENYQNVRSMIIVPHTLRHKKLTLKTYMRIRSMGTLSLIV